MKIDDFNTTLEELFAECRHLLTTKGVDYSGLDDRFLNFKANGERLGMTKYQIWAVYFAKHIDALFNAIKQHPDNPHTTSESIDTRIQDAICYLALMNGMLEEDADSAFGELATRFDMKPRETPVPVPEDVV
jgi:hypothetical protein